MKKKAIQVLLIAVMVCSFVSAGLAADKVIKWKVQGFVPAGMLYHETLERLAAKVEEASGGRLVFEVHPAGSLVPPFEGIKAVSDGVYQANFGYSAQWVGKIPVAPLFSAAPGGFNALGMQMWLNEGGGAELWQEVYDEAGFNVKILIACADCHGKFHVGQKTDPKDRRFQGIENADDALDG